MGIGEYKRKEKGKDERKVLVESKNKERKQG